MQRAIHVNTEKPKPVHQSNWQTPPCQENWDEDDDCTLSTCPFILDQGRTSFFEEEKSSKRMEHTTNGMNGRTSPSRNVQDSPKKPEPVFFTTHFSPSKSENCSLPNCQNSKTEQRKNSPTGRVSPTRNTKPNPLKHESSFVAPTHFSPRKSENGSFSNVQKTKKEQRLNSPTGRVSPAENTKPNPWKHDAACSAATHLNPNTSQNASLQNGQCAQTEQKPNSVTDRTSPAWMTKPNPWKHEAASSPPPLPQSTGESPGFPDSQRNKSGLKANGDTAPRWTTKFSPWKPNVGWSSHCHQNTNEAQSLDKDQWPTTMEQKSNGKMVQTCSCGQNSNHRKTDMGGSSSHNCNPETSENHGLQNYQRSTRMEQKSNGSPTWDHKPSPWKTSFSSGPPSSFQGTCTDDSADDGKRVTPRGQTSNAMSGSSSFAWGPKPNIWKTGSFK